MKTLLSIIVVLVLGIGTAYAYSSAGFPETHYAPTNDTQLELLVMNSTEFKERTTGYNHTLAGIDYNWIPKANNYYDLGGARITYFVWGFDNGTVKGVAFNLDPQLKIKNIFEYNADNPPSGYYSDTCHGCFLGAFNNTKPLVEPKNVIESPLKQLKSGISVSDVKCRADLVHMIKAEDGSPACVKPDSVVELVGRGWAVPHIINFGYNPGRGPATLEQQSSENSTKLNHVIDIISISGTGSLPNPGGPEIQLTLMNIGTKPITNLNATLVLNNNYTFNFKDVTESNPLESNHSTSDTQILIGAGFRTELAYPIIISGIENNMPFRYTENVYIHQ